MRGETQRVADRVRELLDPARLAELPEAVEPESAGPESAGPHDASEDDWPELFVEDEPPTSSRMSSRAPRSGVLPALLSRVAARVPVQLDPGRRAALGVGVAVLVVAVVVGGWLWLSGPRTAQVSSPTPIAGAGTPVGSAVRLPAVSATSLSGAASSGAASSGAAVELVVDVAGKVVRPGVYHLPAGSRVADALAAAGGARRGVDLTSVNLAARVSDGQQIVVGVPGAAAVPGAVPSPGAAPGAVPGSAASTALVNVNSATLDQLETLPGIGPALGQRILDYRTAHGPFTSVDQLNDVSGIGDVKFADLKPLVTV